MSTSSLKALLAPLAVFVIIGATKLWAEASPNAVWLVLAATALLAAADLVAEAHVSTAVFLYSSAAQVVVAVAGSTIGLCLLFAQLGDAPHQTGPAVAFTYLGVGALVGIAVRNRFLASCERRRAGEGTSSVRLQLAFAVGLVVFLFPADRFGSGRASWYVLGFGLGFLVHFAVRRADQRAQRRSKLARRIVKTLGEIGGMPLNAVEVTAVQLFAKRRWRALERLLRAHEGGWTLGLRIVKATRDRVNGQHLEAVRTLRDGLECVTDTEFVHAHLAWLLLAICYRDLGQRDAMWMAIAEAADRRPGCVLLLIFKGLCLTEELPAPGDYDWPDAARSAEAAQLLNRAVLMLPDARPESALAAVVAVGLPLTRRLVDDAYAYWLLKNGLMAPAKTILEACLREDSRSASSHLHLGEYYLACQASAQNVGDGERADQLRRAADFCLRMALALSKNRDSHTRRRAQRLLDAGGAGRAATPETA
jgi:hypothetical protein